MEARYRAPPHDMVGRDKLVEFHLHSLKCGRWKTGSKSKWAIYQIGQTFGTSQVEQQLELGALKWSAVGAGSRAKNFGFI
jgi:hypothetical protein